MMNAEIYLIRVVIFGIITQTVVALLPTDTSNNDSDIATTWIPEELSTEPFSLASSTPNFPGEEEEEEVNESISTLPPSDVTTTSDIDTSTLSPGTNPKSNPWDKCPYAGVKQVAGGLVKCQCQGDEILEDGKCQPYQGVTVIHTLKDWYLTVEANVTDYEVIIRDVKCNSTKYRTLEFTKGQFHLRPRGDMVLKEEAGDLEGQRINNYCVIHHLDSQGDLTWKMRACVPIPMVPRCCHYGYAMKGGSCQPAKTPQLLTPPIAAKPFSNSVEWPTVTNYMNPMKCESDPIQTFPLNYKQSNLVSLANGLANGWVPSAKRRRYNNCPDYCVDGIEKPDGSVEYFTSFCYSDPIELHEKICAGRPCVRKCCKHGYSMDTNSYGCVPDSNSTFNPPTVTNLSNYNIAIGWPLCTPSSKTKGRISIDRNGILVLKDRTIPSTDFCVDTYLDNDAREQSALACLSKTSTWIEVRPILFPICNAISLVFLSITIVCHLLIPKLLANGGVHQLCHSIALVIAYLSSFCVHVFHNFFNNSSCITSAIIMQFGFLTTFFWLNVMCFEIWRKIRRLKNFRPCKTYRTVYYMLYAWGIPTCICIITVVMQYLAPDNIPGVIKPYIGVSRCWFREDIALLTYFYGPIAFLFMCNTTFLSLTYINYKMMLRKHKQSTRTLKDMGTGVNSDQRNATDQRKPTSSMPSRQITDHVHDFKQKLKLFVLMATCWVTEVLSWKIPPLELWALTDTLNSLQGFFIFIILLSNRNKRKQVEAKYALPFKLARKCMKLFFNDGETLSTVNSFASSMSRKVSNSTLVTTFTTTLRSSSNSSFIVGDPSSTPSRSVSVDGSENSIVILSHTPLRSSKSLGCARVSSC